MKNNFSFNGVVAQQLISKVISQYLTPFSLHLIFESTEQ